MKMKPKNIFTNVQNILKYEGIMTGTRNDKIVLVNILKKSLIK